MRRFSEKIGAGLTRQQRLVLDDYSERNNVSRSEIVRKAVEQALVNSSQRMQEQFKITLETRRQIMDKALEKMQDAREKALTKKKREMAAKRFQVKQPNVVSLKRNIA